MLLSFFNCPGTIKECRCNVQCTGRKSNEYGAFYQKRCRLAMGSRVSCAFQRFQSRVSVIMVRVRGRSTGMQRVGSWLVHGARVLLRGMVRASSLQEGITKGAYAHSRLSLTEGVSGRMYSVRRVGGARWSVTGEWLVWWMSNVWVLCVSETCFVRHGKESWAGCE